MVGIGLSDLVLVCCNVGNGCCMSVIAQITYSGTDSILREVGNLEKMYLYLSNFCV